MSRENATAPKWLTPSEMVAWRTYIITSRKLFTALEADLKEHGLTLPDYEILALLSDAPERQMRMSEVAKIGHLSRSRLSHRMKVMEKAGWLKREPCLDDKRGYFAVMTPKGWKAIVAAAPDHVESVRARFIDHLTKADQELIAQIFKRIEIQLRQEVENE
jgi:DNA-binding MarR family transcriptional regulator